MAWVSNDDSNHRIAIMALPGMMEDPSGPGSDRFWAITRAGQR
jgi:hypothetical protein